MKPTDTIVDEPVTIDGWSPRNSTRTNLGPVTPARSLLALDQHDQRQDRRAGRLLDHRRHGAAVRHHHADLDLSRRWCSGSSDVRLIDMTRAFASVANKGVAVTPYGIRRVVTADGRMLYQHEGDEERVLVAPWVAAEMTDLLQSAVLSGTGRAAQIGRPVAGKTGTTTLQQGRLVHRLLERPDDRRVDGPRRCASRSAGCRAAPRRRAPSTIS